MASQIAAVDTTTGVGGGDPGGRKGVVAFLVICFTGSWLYIYAAHSLWGLSLVNPLAQLPFGFMPALAAVVVRRWVTREGFAGAGLRPRFRSAWPYYLAAWLGPLVFAAMAVGLAWALEWRVPGPAALADLAGGLSAWVFVPLLMAAVPLLTPVYWGEEFGWTAFLRQRLFPGRPVRATMATGLIWAVWHYPLAFTGYIEFSCVPLGLAVWTVSFLFQEMLLGWLYDRSGSVWVVSLAHGGNNMVLSLLTGFLLGERAGLGVNTVALLMTAPMALACAVIAVGARRRGKSLARRRAAVRASDDTSVPGKVRS
ncbi:CPBP family intramembrane glutamic endopeptidase [Streptomyces sp. NPDC001678]|uniref:CPBP family intramembrane glutamic endopeptidase n=1 Tax=Streptomyces sp. NPDC001678 TaxID=3364599 RepID=UPI0036966B6A